MESALTLKSSPMEHASMDYALLRRKGVEYLQNMVGELWTDYNTHDPGVTILEQLCYTLTDLAYRIEHPLPNLLAEGGANPYESLFSAAEILTSHPVTPLDLRKLVMDVKGVKNAWIEHVEQLQPDLHFHRENREILQTSGESRVTEPVSLKGVYRVVVEKSDQADRDSGEINDDVTLRLHANRNICEDFESVRILGKQDIQIDASIEIAQVDDAEQVLVLIYQRISDYLSPQARFYSLQELLAEGARPDEIFQGPRLQNGFIIDSELQRITRKTELRTSDLIREIMDVPGVLTVRKIILKSEAQQEDWVLKLDVNKAPQLDTFGSSIRLQREHLDIAVDNASVQERFNNLILRSFQLHKLSDAEKDLQPLGGQNRNLGQYFSIQQQFPDVYGVNGNGLNDAAGPQRRAQAKQLKAYLLFFDQLLANYFAQLAHVKSLFSFSSESTTTYFSSMVDDPELGLDALRVRDPQSHRAALQEIAENPWGRKGNEIEISKERKNRFLNHLLARFAEQFTDYSLAVYGAGQSLRQDASRSEGNTPDGLRSDGLKSLIGDKQAFLRDYPRLSSARGIGFNYLLPPGPENCSGLELRIRRKLGIADNGEIFYLVEHILLRPIEEDRLQGAPLLGQARRKDPYSLQLSVVFAAWPPRFDARFRQFAERTVREETPAHIAVTFQWLEKDKMTVFRGAYDKWLEKRRSYWYGKRV